MAVSSAYRPVENADNDQQDDHSMKPAGRPGLMRGARSQIWLAIILMFLPLVLVAVLIVLIFANKQGLAADVRSINTSSYIIIDGKEQPIEGRYLYVHYSATRLAFISSLAATLSLALVPVALPMLFAYISASALLDISQASQTQLPSPYEFELLLRMLEGGTLEIAHFIKYLFTKKTRGQSIAPVVKNAARMLILMLALALGITIVDALFHLKTISAQYKFTISQETDLFLPGRQLPTNCWNVTDNTFSGCSILAGGSGAATSFTNSTEGYLAVGNQSIINIARLADDGHTTMIVPATVPQGTLFRAESFASSTVCETVTRRCNPHSNRVGSANADRNWAFDCTPEDAGLQWNGNFTAMTAKAPVIFTYFNTSAMITNGTNGNLRNATDGKLWFAVLFYNPRDESSNNGEVIDDGLYYYEEKDIVKMSDGFSYGLLSCTTTLSNVDYVSDVGGNIRSAQTTLMNNTASEPFVQVLTVADAGRDVFNSGIRLVTASSNNKKDLAYQFARLFDRTILSLSSGVLEAKNALVIGKEQTVQIACVPLIELVALAVLNLFYPVIGIVLGVMALILCRRRGVRDVQARLGIGAMVAGVFEVKQLNATATTVRELYADSRNLLTKRVAVEDGPGGSKVLVAVSPDDKSHE